VTLFVFCSGSCRGCCARHRITSSAGLPPFSSAQGVASSFRFGQADFGLSPWILSWPTGLDALSSDLLARFRKEQRAVWPLRFLFRQDFSLILFGPVSCHPRATANSFFRVDSVSFSPAAALAIVLRFGHRVLRCEFFYLLRMLADESWCYF
jgi:hypothetical protein